MVEWSLTGVERQHGAYRFIVKDKEGDNVWIVAELAGDRPLKIIGTTGDDLQVGFELAAGTTRSDAQALARAMNKGIAHIVLF
jgi:hypothetical protein